MRRNQYFCGGVAREGIPTLEVIPLTKYGKTEFTNVNIAT